MTRPGAIAAACIAGYSMLGSAMATTVAVDVGHTPQRPGAMGASGVPEYTYNLALASVVADELQSAGVSVVLIGADGNDIGLADRTKFKESADLLVSIHHDSIQQDWIDAGRASEFAGFAVFVSEKNTSVDASIACAKAVGGQMVSAGERPSLYHAMKATGEGRPVLDKATGVHQFDDLVVLKTARSAALLVEAGVIVNPRESKRLAQAQTRTSLGKAIAAGVLTCLRKMPRLSPERGGPRRQQ